MKRKTRMTTDHKTDFKKKHSGEKTIIPAIEAEINRRVKNGELPCALAFEIVKKSQVPPDEVGRTLDLLNIRLTKCQLGLFGYKPKKKIVKPMDTVDDSATLMAALKKATINNQLSCEEIWAIASRFDMSKLTVSSACESMGIKIKPCQLGAF